MDKVPELLAGAFVASAFVLFELSFLLSLESVLSASDDWLSLVVLPSVFFLSSFLAASVFSVSTSVSESGVSVSESDSAGVVIVGVMAAGYLLSFFFNPNAKLPTHNARIPMITTNMIIVNKLFFFI